MRIKNIRQLVLYMSVCMLFTFFVSCSEDDGPSSPTISDFSGTWSGSILHPAYDGGSLEVLMVEKDAISGSYTMRLTEYIESNGRSRVENYGGELTEGDRNSSSSVSFTLMVSGSLWDFTGTSLAKNEISGDWKVRARPGISGTFQIKK